MVVILSSPVPLPSRRGTHSRVSAGMCSLSLRDFMPRLGPRLRGRVTTSSWRPPSPDRGAIGRTDRHGPRGGAPGGCGGPARRLGRRGRGGRFSPPRGGARSAAPARKPGGQEGSRGREKAAVGAAPFSGGLRGREVPSCVAPKEGRSLPPGRRDCLIARPRPSSRSAPPSPGPGCPAPRMPALRPAPSPRPPPASRLSASPRRPEARTRLQAFPSRGCLCWKHPSRHPRPSSPHSAKLSPHRPPTALPAQAVPSSQPRPHRSKDGCLAPRPLDPRVDFVRQGAGRGHLLGGLWPRLALEPRTLPFAVDSLPTTLPRAWAKARDSARPPGNVRVPPLLGP